MAVLCDAVMVKQTNSVMSGCAMLRWWCDAMSCGGSSVVQWNAVDIQGHDEVLCILRAEIMVLSCLWWQNAIDVESGG